MKSADPPSRQLLSFHVRQHKDRQQLNDAASQFKRAIFR
jgi:hypothetical protein